LREEKNLKNWKLVNFCEFDKYATKSYCAIHGVDESLNLGDITKVDETKLENFNMICGGSPCQDFSVAGKQKGSVWTCKDCGHEYNPLTVHWSQRDKCPNCESNNIEKTRSSLLVEYLRVIRANKPNFGMYENVKNIVGKQFRDTTFKLFEDELHEYGYNTYWKVLNAKDFGIPQNRERVYLIFIKKDLDNGKFVFPEGFDNGIRLKDVLEDKVDEKYYISDDKVQKFLENLKSKNICENDTLKLDGNNYNQRCVVHTPNDFCRTIIGGGGSGGYHAGNEPKVLIQQSENVVKQVGNISDCNGNWKNPQVGRIYDPDGCSPTLNTCGGGSHEPKIVQVGNVNPSGKGMNGNVFSEDGLAPTLTTNKGEGNKILTGIRIRKLTPKETFRLMGFSDSAYDAASKVVSNSQLYKQSGNSIVVDVLYYILVELYKAMPYLFDDLKLSSFFSGIGAFETALDRLYESIDTGNFIKPQAE
jgi:DNA (cytosine-5)-methyltransferase 1